MVRVVRLERTVSWSQTRRDTNFAIPGYSLFCHYTTTERKIKDFYVCGHLCGQRRFCAAFGNQGKSRKRRRCKAFRRFTLFCLGYRHGTPKAGALPTALHPVIELFYPAGRILPNHAFYQLSHTRIFIFLPLYHGRRENQRFFCLWSFMWSKPLLCRFRQPEKILLSPVLQGFAVFRLALFRIPPRHSQTKRATICATPRCSVLKAGVSRKSYYTPEGEKMSSVGACKNALTNPARYGTVNAQTRNSTIRARLPG